VVVEVPVHVVGEAESGTLINLDHPTISLKAEATHLPEYIEVSVEGLEAGTQILAKDLTLPGDAELDADEDVLVVHVTMAPTAEELEAEVAPEVAPEEAEAAPEAEAEAEGAAAEGEGAGEASSDES
ncbi:MAG: 50S ribosomal protein L25, partial [bacterium]